MSPEYTNRDLVWQIPADLQRLAKTAKIISVDDPRVVKYQEGKGTRSHHQYRNNFVMNFEALQTFIKGEEFGEFDFHKIYLEDFNKPRKFYEENRKLCDEIFDALDELGDYEKLLHGFISFYSDNKYALGDRLNEMVPHPFGIEAVGIYAWDRLNPLLKKADKALKNLGVNTKDWGR